MNYDVYLDLSFVQDGRRKTSSIMITGEGWEDVKLREHLLRRKLEDLARPADNELHIAAMFGKRDDYVKSTWRTRLAPESAASEFVVFESIAHSVQRARTAWDVVKGMQQ